MRNPVFTKLIDKLDRDLFRDLGFLFVGFCFVLVQLYGYTLQHAALTAPLLVLGLLVGLYLLIQGLWLMMCIMDRISDVFRLRRSPLS